MGRGPKVDWDPVFRHMRRTGCGVRAAARRFGLPAGTVLSAVHREKERPAGRLDSYEPRKPPKKR